MIAEIKYSIKRSRDKVKELFQKVESKHRDEKQKGKDEKIEESNTVLMSIMERNKENRCKLSLYMYF